MHFCNDRVQQQKMQGIYPESPQLGISDYSSLFCNHRRGGLRNAVITGHILKMFAYGIGDGLASLIP